MFNLVKLFNKNVKFYKHFISLGYNCECAYRFFQRYNFVESSLFTWTNSKKAENLIYALKNLDAILCKTPEQVDIMWRCVNTDILFHGTEPYDMHRNPEKYNEDDYLQYKEELVSRVSYLKKKFIGQISDEKKTLLTYTYYSQNEEKYQISDNIIDIKSALDRLGALNYDLLIILEKKNDLTDEAEKFKDQNIYIRYVDEFAPQGDVTTKKYDKKSWQKILNEFRPDFKLKKKKNSNLKNYNFLLKNNFYCIIGRML